MPSPLPRYLATLFPLLVLTACGAPLVLGAAATAGYVGLQDRPSAQVAIDAGIKTRIKGYLAETEYNYLTDIGIDVYYNDVLVTGVVPTQADGEKVIGVVKATQGVKKVYNELFVGAEYSTGQRAKDAWIAAQIQPRLIGTKGVYPLNYLVTVVNNHVYAIGSCETAVEHTHVLHILRTTKGVQQVHDYLVILPPEEGARPNTIEPGKGLTSMGQTRDAPALPDDPLAH
ncbi:MAG: BON domain-containing protein [Proteobacteria bacterium]|nr:BON domain-containing protein [Pseudomonadota bacterium]